MSRISRESQDVERAQAELKTAVDRGDEVSRALEADLQAVAARWDEGRDQALERVLIKPKRGGISVQLVALVWIPQ